LNPTSLYLRITIKLEYGGKPKLSKNDPRWTIRDWLQIFSISQAQIPLQKSDSANARRYQPTA